ncbi:hypothetical protein A1O3_05980 [Capronia epimyces CBS 606.96]|uniref:N-acetyltransferase domain-containing protein n=1 Tax=Capronia epimyces CBS 606.96 TaxID=1182542 RepID=W9Y6P4_9EURO|nr:uncharacterized protein A1O3_05980 [Capronia epimyces CBS 606.96]EXJ85305.1 hypothetical protein A1O3_05980 [Capronia epimyces CBS 606.96]
MHLVLSRIEPKDLDAVVPILFKSFHKIDLANVFFGRESPASYAYAKRQLLEGMQKDPADVFLKIEDLDAEADVNVLDDKGNTVRTERRKRIVCVSNWKIYPTYVTPQELQQQQHEHEHGQGGQRAPTDNKPDYGDGDGDGRGLGSKLELKAKKAAAEPAFSYLETEQERSDAATLMEDFLSRRRRECREAHVLCFLLFTDPDYQGKGCGRMMMQWGNDVADALMLPCWIEASPEGELLYLQMGYLGRERVRIQTKSFLGEYLHMRRPLMVERVRLEGRTLVREPAGGSLSN